MSGQALEHDSPDRTKPLGRWLANETTVGDATPTRPNILIGLALQRCVIIPMTIFEILTSLDNTVVIRDPFTRIETERYWTML